MGTTNSSNANARFKQLKTAIENKKIKDVIDLLAKGASVAIKDANGDNALHIALQTDDPLRVQLLIVFGADVNGLNNSGESPRHKAATTGSKNRDYIIYLLHHVGANRCTQDLGCNDGCKHGGSDDGTPVTVDQQKVLDGVMKEAKNAAVQTQTVRVGDRVLCMDGGGIRGLIQMPLLWEIEKKTQQPIKDCFDWIGGTSTGGILALAIAQGKTIQQCFDLYFQLKDTVFDKRRPHDFKKLEAFLQQNFGVNDVMSQLKNPRVMVTGVLADRSPAELHLFRNYMYDNPMGARDRGLPFQRLLLPKDQYVWEVARATSSAPTYFKSCGAFLDGGMMSNNPTLDVLTEIHQFNRAQTPPGVAQPQRVVVSLGTGRMPVQHVEDFNIYIPNSIKAIGNIVRGAKNILDLFIDLSTQSDGQVVERAEAWCSMIDVPFFRFSPQLSEEIELDCIDDATLINMLWETRCYIHYNNDRIDQLCSLLKKKSDGQ